MVSIAFKKLAFNIVVCTMSVSCFAQASSVNEINRIITPNTGLAPLRFLASDELMGRATARPEINIAARYISEAFRSYGLRQCDGATDYFQAFNITMVTPAISGSLQLGNLSYHLGDDMVETSGADVQISASIVYAGFGSANELDKIDVKGKIVVTNMGASDSSSFMEGYHLIKTKQKWVQERGGIALIERFKKGSISWNALKLHFIDERVESDDANNFGTFLINDSLSQLPQLLQSKTATASFTITGTKIKIIPARNVMGWVEGTDASLKNQFIVLSAHYDHLGVAKQPQMVDGKLDSVYNGTRDNAIGVTAVIDAALYFAQHPAKRSILFIAYTGEEIGEIGSKYFSQHPLFPLKQMVYNLNIDNGGYNDTSMVSVIGLGRTSADDDMRKAAAAFGMQTSGDPAPEQDFFDRSDNVNLAVKGIPAPTYGMGVKTLDDDIMKHYHQLSDEIGNCDVNYVIKYIRSYILASQNIADNTAQPTWTKGDKYESAWKDLYKK